MNCTVFSRLKVLLRLCKASCKAFTKLLVGLPVSNVFCLFPQIQQYVNSPLTISSWAEEACILFHGIIPPWDSNMLAFQRCWRFSFNLRHWSQMLVEPSIYVLWFTIEGFCLESQLHCNAMFYLVFSVLLATQRISINF